MVDLSNYVQVVIEGKGCLAFEDGGSTTTSPGAFRDETHSVPKRETCGSPS